jgi:hypothetical protein
MSRFMLANFIRRISIFTLILPLVNALMWAQAAQEPSAVLESYCKLDASGIQPKPRGWLQLARMFIPDEPPPGLIKVTFDKLEVIRGFTISEPIIEGSDAVRFNVRYSPIGNLNYTSLLFSPIGTPNPGESKDTFRLVLTTKHFDLDSRAYGVLATVPKGWRIQGIPHTPHINIEAALELVSRLRDTAETSEAKVNADQSVAALRKLRNSPAGKR